MAFTDWFKKAKEAKEKKEKGKPKNEYGNLSAGSDAYKAAQDALDDEDKKGGQYASND